MKKIILAPAVALAFTGLVASPVAAAESPSSQSSSAEQKQAETEKIKKEEAKKKAEAEEAEAEEAEAEKKAAAEKAEADKKAKEKAEAEKKAAADKAAADKKKAAAKKAAEDEADEKKDDKPKTPKKVDPKPAPSPKDEDKDDESEDTVNPINASMQVTSGEVSAEELHEDGVTVKVTGLEKGDKVSAASGLTGPAATAQGSTATLKLHSAKELNQESVSFAVKVQREGTEAKKLPATAEIDVQAAIDASLSVSPDEITAEDLADKSNGVDVTVTGVEEGDEIKDSLTGKTETAEADGSHKLHLWYEGNPDNLEEGPVPFTVTIDRKGEGSETLNGEINVADETADGPKVSLNTDEISQTDFNKNGIKVTGEGFTPGGKVTVVGGGAQSAFATEEVEADEDGKVSATLKFEGEGDLPAGEYSVWGVDQETDTNSDAQAFTITDDDAVEAIDASLKVDPKEITAEDLADKDKGVTVTVTGVKKGDKIKDSLTGKTETADGDGEYTLHLWYEGNPDNLEEGKVPFTVTIDREGTESETLKGNINVVAEDSDDGDGDTPEAPAEATLTVSPKTIEAPDFANEKKGVTLAVENCEPGQDVHFEVNPKGINVTAYENTVKADDEGNASVNVFGTSSDASAYVGSYTATATCGDDTMKDSFKVTAGAKGGDSGNGGDNGNAGNGSGDDGSQLPRTGADLGGLTTGALLLLVGGAAIALTGRKNKFGQTPTSF